MRVDSEVGEVAEVLVQLKGEWVGYFLCLPIKQRFCAMGTWQILNYLLKELILSVNT